MKILKKIDHLGYACEDIPTAIAVIQDLYEVESISEVIFDAFQNASLCYITTSTGPNVELVCGVAVKSLLAKGLSLYHTCYEVDALEEAIEFLKHNGGVLVKPPYPAPLFHNRRVAFLETTLGLIELVESSSSIDKNLQQICITGTFTIDNIQDNLKEICHKLNLNMSIKSTEYNLVIQTLYDKSSIFYKNKRGYNLILLRVEDWLRYHDIENTTPASQIKVIADAAKDLTAAIYYAVNQHINLSLVLFPETGNIYPELLQAINAIEQDLKLNLPANVMFYKLNLDNLNAEFSDPQINKIAHIPYTATAMFALSLEIIRKIHLRMRKPYKVIVVDCDNTLWDGVCSEDDAANLKISAAQFKLQQKLYELSNNGVLVCICSKNVESDVINVFNIRNEMPLKMNNITHCKINWQNKSTNIIEIAEVLNLNLEDFVFIDDNPLEIAEVSSTIPQMLCIQFPIEEQLRLELIQNLWCLDHHGTTSFDLQRSEFYKSNIQRQELKHESKSFAEFLEQLQITTQIDTVTPADYPRIAQLTQRTNQFNCSNKQRNATEIEELIQQKLIHGYKINVQDRFGDYGLVGLIFIANEEYTSVIDTFVLSCRVLGKGIEHIFLKTIAKLLLSQQKHNIAIEFRSTSKNTPALNFLNSLPAIRVAKNTDFQQYNFNISDLTTLEFNPKIAENFIPTIANTNVNSARIHDNIVLQKIAAGCFNKQLVVQPSIISLNTNLADIESFLLIAWQKILNTEVELDCNFFKLGGDSLLAIRVISRIKQAYQIEIDLDAIFQHAELKQLAKFIHRKANSSAIQDKHLATCISKSKIKSLSFTQKWLWLLDQFDNENTWYYNMPFSQRLKGTINIYALEYALEQVMRRHAVLRMRLPLNNGNFTIDFHDHIPKVLEIIDVANYTDTMVKDEIDALYRVPFKLSSDLLFKVYLLRRSDHDHILLFVTHHIVSDGWSTKIINHEISEFYQAFLNHDTPCLPSLTIDFFDYVSWQDYYIKQKSKQQLAFWKEHLKNLPKQNFPLDQQRKGRTHLGKYFAMNITTETSNKIQEIAQNQQTTLFSILITLYAIFIAKHCDTNDIIITCPVSGRRHADAENLVGCFVNITIFRFNIDLSKSFLDNLQYNRNSILASLENQDLPYEILLKELHLDQQQLNSSLLQMMFALQNTNVAPLNIPAIESSIHQFGYDAARLEFILELELYREQIIGGIYYNTDLFSESTIKKYCHEYQSLCDYVLNDLSQNLSDFWNQESNLSILRSPINYNTPNYIDIIDWFENTVITFPENIALQTNLTKITYDQLNVKANQLAHYLLQQNLNTGSIVAVMLPATELSIITILAILKIGAAYLPIDSNAPDDYFKSIITDSGCSFIITSSQIDVHIPCLIISDVFFLSTLLPKNNLSVPQRDLAYIIYTSGTTGKPKGVKIPHHNIVQLMASTQGEYNFTEHDATILFHSIAFDFSVWEIWLALCYGGKLYIPSRQQTKSAQDTFEIVVNQRITVLNQTPTAFKQFMLYAETMRDQLSNLRLVVLGGEKLVPQDLLNFSNNNQHINFYNMYGITETSVHTTIKKITRKIMDNSSNIGTPLPGRVIYLLDDNLNPVARGNCGEIYVGGLGLAAGYHNLPELSAKVFLPDILNPQQLMYKSGDLAKIINDELEYIGRKDKQVQLRGFRIELSGIESTLNAHPAVKYSAVNVIADKLVAFVIPDFTKVSPSICDNPSDALFALPNGMKIHHLNKNETEFLYEEIFENNEYFCAGIELNDSPCIIDVGANIGMFAIYATKVATNAKVFALEPIPEIFKILETNANLYGPNITPIKAGLASHKHSKIIGFYPRMSIMSSLSDDLIQDQKLIATHLKAKLGMKYELLSDNEISELISSYLEKQDVLCEFETLDNIIAQHNIKTIDLLKVDVERHELDVLLGISDENWKLIRQCVIEVHNLNNSLAEIITLLQKHGFTCKTQQYHNMQHSELYMLYASRDVNFPNNNETKIIPTFFEFNENVEYLNSLRAYMKVKLPDYMIPQHFKIVDKMPMTMTGKIDFSEFNNCNLSKSIPSTNSSGVNKLLDHILKTWGSLLGHNNISPDDNFFDIGGNSLLTIQAFLALREVLPNGFRMLDFFSYPTARKLATKIAAESSFRIQPKQSYNVQENYDIAIIGYAGKFPKSDDIEQFWQNIINGIDCITHFDARELLNLGVDPKYVQDDNFVRACGKIDNIDLFDNDFFGIPPREAALLDPQHRILLEVCWRALEAACYTPDKTTQKIGIFGGMGNTNYLDTLYDYHGLRHTYGRDLIVEISNHKDYLVNRVAYKLNLSGASININTACSTSLVAVVKACQSLYIKENDIALAGAVSLVLPQHFGYFHQAENVLSPDGVCRPFDTAANGTVIGSGAGIVVLKRLNDAIRDGDNISAVIKGYAVNNDGNTKIGFTAPAVSGQVACITTAHEMANIQPVEIGYIEAHGTGTKLGDPIEIQALQQVFASADEPYCALGSVKANIGHADCASGIASLIKVILMLQKQQLPPAVNFKTPNDEIDFNNSPFYVNTIAKPWLQQRTAGISSFGIGGTNAHIIITEAPLSRVSKCSHDSYLIIISAKTIYALTEIQKQLLDQISEQPNQIADIAFSLQIGRKDFEYRRAWVVNSNNALRELQQNPSGNIKTNVTEQLHQIALQWIQGEIIDWSNMHQKCQHRRLSVAVHPFSPKRHWYTDVSFETEVANNSIIDTLTTYGRFVLGIKEISDDDDFFNLGGDSLAALTFIERVNSKLNCNLTLDTLYQARTFANLSGLIINKQQTCAKFWCLKQSHSQHNLIVIHAIGGSVYCYNEIVTGLNNYNVYGISSENSQSIPNNSIEAIATQYIKLIQERNLQGTISLLGWSFGGSVAFEIAKQLRLQNVEVQHVYMLDTWCKFGKNFATDEATLRELFLKRISTVNDDQLAKQWNNAIYERTKVLLSYNPKPYPIATTLFKASILHEEFASEDEAHNHWQQILQDKLTVVNIAADHTSIVNQNNSLILAKYLDSKVKNLVEI